MRDVRDKRAVSPLDQMVFCPLGYREVPLRRCLDCTRLVRADDNDPPRYVVCDARMLDRREAPAARAPAS